MSFHVRVSLTAQADVERISDWLRERSETWAERWVSAFESALVAVGWNGFFPWSLAIFERGSGATSGETQAILR